MKKKLLSLLAVSAMLVACLTGCGQSAGSLKVGMEIGYPPFEYYDADGTTPTGLDVELAKEIGKRMGMEVELIDTAWDGIFAGLKKGDYDCIMSAVTITPDRLLEFDFSEPYIQNMQCIVSLKGSDVQVTDIAQLSGLRVGYQEETTSDIYLTNYADATGLECETFEYAKVMNCYDELELGRIDAIICDSTVATSYVSDPDSVFEITWTQPADEEIEEFGVCIQKGNTELLDKVNKALAEIKADGTLDALLEKYF